MMDTKSLSEARRLFSKPEETPEPAPMAPEWQKMAAEFNTALGKLPGRMSAAEEQKHEQQWPPPEADKNGTLTKGKRRTGPSLGKLRWCDQDERGASPIELEGVIRGIIERYRRTPTVESERAMRTAIKEAWQTLHGVHSTPLIEDARSVLRTAVRLTRAPGGPKLNGAKTAFHFATHGWRERHDRYMEMIRKATQR